LGLAGYLVLFVLCASSAGALGQNLINISPQQCVWQAGDNPAWVAPNLDESAWRHYDVWKPIAGEPRFWVRCHANPSSLRALSHPAVQVRISSAYELYFNGVPLGNSGDLDNGNFSINAISAYPIPSELLSSDSAMTICLRLTHRDLVFVPNQILDSLEPNLQLFLGDKPLLDAMRAQIVLERESHSVGVAVCYGVIGVIAMMLLGLFLYDRSRYELLLLSIDCMCLTTARLNEFGTASMLNYSFAMCQAVQILCTIGFTATQVMFIFALARRRVPVIFWALMAATILITSSFTLEVLMGSRQPTWAGSLDYTLLHTLMLAGEIALSTGPFFAFWPYAQVTRRMGALAGLCMFLGVSNLAYYGVLFQSSSTTSLFAHWGRVVLEFRAFTHAGVLAAILALLFREQQKTAKERALLAGEMQAARAIQSLLAPATLETIPGLFVDVVFHPMRDVGGDFYSCRILAQDRQRVLIGDVSGKGAAAAMTAAVLIGAAQRRNDESPAALLAHLNQVLAEMRLGGFATCLCADLSPEGALTVANAGHLAPYRNGEEVMIESGLPLGIAPDAAYTESTVRLAPNDRLTLLSDGVVEAQSVTGELFGFDRTRDISMQSAEEIACAAQAHGQEDDITVLTFTFAPSEGL
jgi:hypothetical protein